MKPKAKLSPPWYQFSAQAEETVAELRIFGPIGGDFFYDEDAITGKAIASKLEALPDEIKSIRVLVNSPGGNVFDGVHIANALRRQREEHGRAINVEIEALAASAATLITSAGSTVKMPRNALMMIHNPTGYAEGPVAIMRKTAEALDRVAGAIVATYRWISKLPSKKLRALMDETTWMDADEALANGLITEIVAPFRARASFDGAALEHLATVPEQYRQRLALLCSGPSSAGICNGAEFADLANDAIDERLEDEDDLTRADVLEELQEATGQTEETIDDILSGELECPEAEIVSGFVSVLPLTAEQANTALEADGCETEDKEDKAADTVADLKVSIKCVVDDQERGKMKPKTNQNGGEDAKAIKAAERDRIAKISGAAATAIKAGLKPERVAELQAAAVTAETTVEDFKAQIVDELAELSDATGPGANDQRPDIVPGEDERDKRRTGIQAALLLRSGVADTVRRAAKKRPDEPAFKVEWDPGEFRGMSLLDHARDTLEKARAGSTRGRNKMELAGDFLNLGGAQSTSDFAVALEDALHKTLMAAFALAPDTWRAFCAIGSVSDFRAHNRYKRGGLSTLEKVLESGEFKNKAITDAEKEIQQAATYGNIIALTRQAIVNDDMGFFTDMAMALGRAAGLTIEQGVYDTLLLNSGLGPTMQDTNPLFDAAHSNLGGGAALAVASIDADRVVMASQTGVGGNEILDLRPSVLVLPIGLGGAARVLNESQYDHDSTELMKPNAVVGLFRQIVDSPRLTGTRRYLFADPADSPVLEVAFLEGEQNPFIDLDNGWRIDGVEWKVRHDFGIAAVDWRGAVTDAGA